MDKNSFPARTIGTPPASAWLPILLSFFAWCTLALSPAQAAYTFATFAGSGTAGSDNGPAPQAQFYTPLGVAVDPAGNVYVVNSASATLRKISTNRIVANLAPSFGFLPSSFDGICTDSLGNVYFTLDWGIQQVSSIGMVSNVAGQYLSFGDNDGQIQFATFWSPHGVAVDGSGVLYVADTQNNSIRKISNGTVSTLAGPSGGGYGGNPSGDVNAVGSDARFSGPQGVAIDGSGNVFVADSGNAKIKKITPDGTVSTFAGPDDGLGNPLLAYPVALALDSSGNVFVADAGRNTVVEISSAGVGTTIGGDPLSSDSSDGTGSAAHFLSPGGIAVNDLGLVFVSDSGANTIKVGSVQSQPTITGQPAGQTLLETQTAVFSVTTTGGYVAYQWRKDGAPITGQIGPTLTLPAIRPADAGTYDVIATNSSGSATSNGATLTVTPIPVIGTLSPVRQVVTPGSGFSLSVSATGNGGLSYQWYRTGALVTGATSPVYSVVSSSRQDEGWYQVLVTDANGTRHSAPVFVIVSPAITQVREWSESGFSLPDMPTGLSDVVAIPAGPGTLVVRRDGTVTGWGYYPDGLVDIPVGLAGVVAIDSDGETALALKSDGTVVAWGDNAACQTDIPAGLSNVVAVSCGGSGTCVATKSDGSVTAWGRNDYGQASVPAGLSSVAAVRAGLDFSVALKNDGTVVAWGDNTYGECTIPAGLNHVIAIAAGGYHTVALKDDGKVVAWGSSFYGESTPPAGLADVVGVAANDYSAAIRADGTVVTWGVSPGNFAPPSDLANVLALSPSLALRDGSSDALPAINSQPADAMLTEPAGFILSVTASGPGPLTYQWLKDGQIIDGATSADYAVVASTPSDSGDYDVIVTDYLGSTQSATAIVSVAPLPIITPVSAARQVLAPGSALSLSVTASGTGALSYQWSHNGRPVDGATAVSYGVGTVTASDGGWYVVTVTDDIGTRSSEAMFVLVSSPQARLIGWGNDSYGLSAGPLALSRPVAVAAGLYHAFALQADGTLVPWGSDLANVNRLPSGLTGVVAIAAGDTSSFALKSDGTVVGWGVQQTGDVVDAPSGLSHVVAIAAVQNHALALRSDGTVIAWGGNDFGESTVPTGLNSVVAIAAGSYHSLALKSDGTVVAWGTDSSGERDVPSGLSGVTAISAGWQYSLALKSDGTLISWGRSPYTDPVQTGLSNALTIATGQSSSLAIKANGTVVGWANDYGMSSAVPGPANVLGATGIAVGPNVSFAIISGTASPLWHGPDFNGDGKDDLVWTNTVTGDRSVWFMNGTSIDSFGYLAGIDPVWHIVGTGDFNADGKTDLVWENLTTGDRTFWQMNGTDIDSFGYLAYVDPIWHIAAIGDFNADGKPDVIWENTTTGDRAVWFLNGQAIDSFGYIAGIDPAWHIVGAGDFDGDGQTDLVWENFTTGDRTIWYMNGATLSSFGYIANIPGEWHIATVTDIDGDGHPDLVWEDTTTGDRAIWLMNNATQLSAPYLAGIDPVWRIDP
jgi:alpha-tubulin suppressor-like RCC1 family protein